MGSKWFTGGVVAAPHGRIQFDFILDGIRYRPSIRRPPSEANLRRARERLEDIKRQIEVGTFSFAEEFPDYRFLQRVIGGPKIQLCGEVFDDFLKHCTARYARGDLAFSTLSAYRRVLDGVWRPALGRHLFHQISYSRLVAIADQKAWSKKTYNNVISILRRVFDFGYQDRPDQHNPARSLRSARLKKKDRPKIDPFCIQDAETLIAAIHREWGEAQGNYDEFRFFTGLRPSEEIALVVSDLDLVNGIVSVNKARVAGVDRCQTKTGEDRRITLCPRALMVLKRQLAVRARLEAAGLVQHGHVFFRETGEPFWNLQIQSTRWRATLNSLKLRYRRPYAARHSSVSWNLMAGQNALWVAKQHGHSIATMLRVYAAWAEGAVETDVEAIKRSTSLTPSPARRGSPVRPPEHCRCGRRSVPKEGFVPAAANLAVVLPVDSDANSQVAELTGKLLAEREGFECFGVLINQYVIDSKITFVPSDPPQSPSLSPTSSLEIPLLPAGIRTTPRRIYQCTQRSGQCPASPAKRKTKRARIRQGGAHGNCHGRRYRPRLYMSFAWRAHSDAIINRNPKQDVAMASFPCGKLAMPPGRALIRDPVSR